MNDVIGNPQNMVKQRSVILVIGKVNDAPNQIRYQRVSMLASIYRLIVVTSYPIPPSLSSVVEKVYICSSSMEMWRRCLSVGRHLKQANRGFYIHTQYAPYPLIAGFLCNRLVGCPWIYDLWDHPSLTWSSDRGIRRWLKQLYWVLVLQYMLKSASAWIIGMHPGVLSHLPVPNRKCHIILTGPGVELSRPTEGGSAQLSTADNEVVICYAGKLTSKRGAGLILDWVAQYNGIKVRLELMGPYDESFKTRVKELQENRQISNSLHINLHGKLSHVDVLRILGTGDIGICLIDPTVLNYRYAYPIKIVEYMSKGLVTVATDGHGVRSMLQHGGNGFIANYDIDSFIRTMDEAIRICVDKERKRVLFEYALEKSRAYERNAVNLTLLHEIDSVLER